MYFNEVPYGGATYGVEEAAQKYFGKHAGELNLAEASLLAGLPAAPTRFSPFGAYPTLAKERQKQVINEMVKAGFISEEEGQTTSRLPLRFSYQNGQIFAPHFVFYVKDILVERYGEKEVEEGGLMVKTSLDLNLQKKVELIVKEEVEKLKSYHVTNAAAIVINPKTGEILTMVGSKDYFDFSNDGNVNVVLRPRQPGSAIKPINYAAAFSLGFTPATIISDTPITYQIPGQLPYSPQNYDGKFHGLVPVRTALGSSLNVPAVKVLASLGIPRMVELGKKMGITTWDDSSRFGLSLTLGGGEVTLLDLASAYSVFANMGQKVLVNPISKIDDRGGVLFENNPERPAMVLDSGTAFLINDILSDNQARVLAFGQNSLLNTGDKRISVKTGTSNNLRDNWAIGYTPNFLVGVWVGNNDNSAMSRIASGITGATPIWRRITDLLLLNNPQTGWEKPAGVEEVKICKTTGTLPCDGCPQVTTEYFLESTMPHEACHPEQFQRSEGKPNTN